MFSDTFEFDWHGDVLDIDISAEEVRGELVEFDFSILAAKVLVEHDAVPGHLKVSYKVKLKRRVRLHHSQK